MGRFDHHPVHIRRKIALIATIGTAVVLLGVLVFLYTKPSYRTSQDTSMARLHSFYTTIITSGQSYFINK